MELGKGVYVRVINLGERRKLIDIRQWSRSGKPRRGIHLSPTSWWRLLGVNELLVADIFNVKRGRSVNKCYHIGANKYASIRGWKVNLLVGEWKSLSLNFSQWSKLIKDCDTITNALKDNKSDVDELTTDMAELYI